MTARGKLRIKTSERRLWREIQIQRKRKKERERTREKEI